MNIIKKKKIVYFIIDVLGILFKVFIAYGLFTTFPLVWFLIYYFNGWAF